MFIRKTRQRAYCSAHPEIVLPALFDEIFALSLVLDNVPGHPGGEEPPGNQLGQALQAEVGEEEGVGQVDLEPVVGVHLLLLVLRLFVLKHQAMQLLASFPTGGSIVPHASLELGLKCMNQTHQYSLA